jgi:hypothetical protein
VRRAACLPGPCDVCRACLATVKMAPIGVGRC